MIRRKLWKTKTKLSDGVYESITKKPKRGEPEVISEMHVLDEKEIEKKIKQPRWSPSERRKRVAGSVKSSRFDLKVNPQVN